MFDNAGTLTRWHLHPAAWLHRLPDTVSFEEGSLCEPLSVALAGIERAELRLGDPVLIWYDPMLVDLCRSALTRTM
jgi:threonine dehydrogenase-like Zn-dependent dehydrogenase